MYGKIKRYKAAKAKLHNDSYFQKFVESKLEASKTNKVQSPPIEVSDSDKEYFEKGLETLTPTEFAIYNAYIAGSTTKEIMSTLGIKENTLKFHNKNIYSKLGVSSRKQLLGVYRAISEQIK